MDGVYQTSLALDGEDEANARLIASAPKLLEALEGLYQSLYNGLEVMAGSDEYNAARDAIKQAKGE